MNMLKNHRRWQCGACLTMILAWMVTHTSKLPAQDPSIVFERLPSSTVAALVTTDAAQALENMQKTGPTTAFSGPAFRPFLNAATKIQPIFDPTSLSPLPWQATVDLLGNSAFAFVVIEGDDQLPELAILLEINDDEDQWEQMMTKHMLGGQKLQQTKIDGVTVTQAVMKNQLFETQAVCEIDGWLLICESEAGAKQFIAASKKVKEQQLINDPRFLQTIAKTEVPKEVAGAVWVFSDPLRADFLRARDAGWPEKDMSKAFGARQGFDAVRAIGGWGILGEKRFDARYRFRIWIEQPVEKGMNLLDLQRQTSTVPSKWVPSSPVSSYATLGWNLDPILDHVGPLVNEMVEDITGKSENTFERFLEQLEADDGPGINLQNDFMPLLGKRIEYISIFVPPASTTAERSIVGIELDQSIPQVEAEVADLIELLVDDGSTLPIRIPGYPYPLWKLGSGQRAGNGPSFSTPGVMVADGRLFVASNYTAIQEYVVTKKAKVGFEQSPEYLQVAKVLDETAGTSPAIRVVAFPGEDFENTYELLRTGRVDQAESIYTMLLAPILKASKQQLPFEKLPDFEILKQTLGPTGIQLNLVENGWELTGVNFKAPKK